MNHSSTTPSSPMPGTEGRTTPSQGRRLRIALYSHDTMGLGHKRRNLLIAQTLGNSALEADILLISGMRDASNLPTPDGVDTLTLPALHKGADGQYQSRRMKLALNEMTHLRSQLILTAIKGFQPDVLIVDNVPRGAVRELDPTLRYLKRSKPHSHQRWQKGGRKPSHASTRCVLGLRDVLDTPTAVHRDWHRADNLNAIRRYYDAVWIYGDSDLYDLRQEYGFPTDITQKMHPLGYLDQRSRLNYINPIAQSSLEHLSIPETDELVLCLVGGGQDGQVLAEAFVQSTFPTGTTGVLLTGPFMPAEVQQVLHAQAEQNPQLQILDYIEEPTLLLDRANRVIAMGGYNTTCEILSFRKTALLIPRVSPRLEQWIRAERLQQKGMIDVLHPKDISPGELSRWLHKPMSSRQSSFSLNLNGLDNLLVELQALLSLSNVPFPQAS